MKRLLLLGVGNAARAVNQQAADLYDTKFGTTREAGKTIDLESIGLKPIIASRDSAALIEETSKGADVVVSFPPDPDADRFFSNLCRNARKIVYISSTGVYGGTTGIITEDSPVDHGEQTSRARLDAERYWQDGNAVVLRAPALYGPNYGLHISLQKQQFKIPGDGKNFSSRIHLEDLATIILKALEFAKPGSLYVVGDLQPATNIEVVEWLCKRMGIDLPDSVPLQQVHFTLRSNRQVKPDRVLKDLGITLKYPDYKTGFEHCLKDH